MLKNRSKQRPSIAIATAPPVGPLPARSLVVRLVELVPHARAPPQLTGARDHGGAPPMLPLHLPLGAAMEE